jgi:hypothetical protein
MCVRICYPSCLSLMSIACLAVLCWYNVPTTEDHCVACTTFFGFCSTEIVIYLQTISQHLHICIMYVHCFNMNNRRTWFIVSCILSRHLSQMDWDRFWLADEQELWIKCIRAEVSWLVPVVYDSRLASGADKCTDEELGRLSRASSNRVRKASQELDACYWNDLKVVWSQEK